MAVAVNFLLFQAGWFACVLGAAAGFPWQGALVALLIAGYAVVCAARPRSELALVAAAALAGFAFDSALALSGWVVFGGAVPAPLLAPIWMVALWALFATTLNVSLRGLRQRRWRNSSTSSMQSLMGATRHSLMHLPHHLIPRRAASS